MLIPVALRRAAGYDPESLAVLAADLLGAAGVVVRPGERVLVKPNLVAPTNAELATTHPAVVAAACRVLLDRGAKVVVGDSPAFGSAITIGRKTGLDAILARLGVPLVTLGSPVRVRTSVGGIGVARQALEADRILNLPRLKAHGQLRLSLAVKNLFGCVVGFRKALAHACHGDKADRFERLLVDVMLALPPVASVLDGITAMHVKGPTGGRPIDLGLLAASADPTALDVAVYGMLGPLQEAGDHAAARAPRLGACPSSRLSNDSARESLSATTVDPHLQRRPSIPQVGVQGPVVPGEERVQREGEEPSLWPPEAKEPKATLPSPSRANSPHPGLSPADVPLWREAGRRGLPGADPANLSYPLERPEAFDCSGFVLPTRLDPVTFHPVRLVRGRLKSLWLRLG